MDRSELVRKARSTKESLFTGSEWKVLIRTVAHRATVGRSESGTVD